MTFLPKAITYLGTVRSEELIERWIEQVKKEGSLVLDSPRTGSIYVVNPNDTTTTKIPPIDRQAIVDSAPQWLAALAQSKPIGDSPI